MIGLSESKSIHIIMTVNFFLISFALFMSHLKALATDCQDTSVDRSNCEDIVNWHDLRRTVEQSDGLVILCPFSLTKTEKDPTVLLSKSVNVICKEEGKCNIHSPGTHIKITSESPVFIEGITFSGATSSSLLVTKISLRAGDNMHTICNSLFVR